MEFKFVNALNKKIDKELDEAVAAGADEILEKVYELINEKSAEIAEAAVENNPKLFREATLTELEIAQDELYQAAYEKLEQEVNF
jgi:hypothetical protein